ncbi:MAG: translation initiation factor IF-3 [Planctomycetes bacterium]|nr:translation initiation factor IF-3 [Planctomycetota bacterium]
MPQIRLIDSESNQRGVVDTFEAMREARDLGLDLVEIAPHERPPVCRIMDYGRHKYTLKKRQKQSATHEVTLKEVRLRPKTDDNDRNIKISRAEKFLSQGHKVQFTMLFRGRERQHTDMARATFMEIIEYFGEAIKVERFPKSEGRRMTMVIAPTKKTIQRKPKPQKKKTGKRPDSTQDPKHAGPDGVSDAQTSEVAPDAAAPVAPDSDAQGSEAQGSETESVQPPASDTPAPEAQATDESKQPDADAPAPNPHDMVAND